MMAAREASLQDAWEILSNPWKLLSSKKNEALLAEYGITEARELAYCKSENVEALAENIKPIPRQVFIRCLQGHCQRDLVFSRRIANRHTGTETVIDVEELFEAPPYIKREPGTVASSSARHKNTGVTFTVTLENRPSRPHFRGVKGAGAGPAGVKSATGVGNSVSVSKATSRSGVVTSNIPSLLNGKRSRSWADDDSLPVEQSSDDDDDDDDNYRAQRRRYPGYHRGPRSTAGTPTGGLLGRAAVGIDGKDGGDAGDNEDDDDDNDYHDGLIQRQENGDDEEFGVECPLCSVCVKHYSPISITRHLKEDHASTRTCTEVIVESMSSWRCPVTPCSGATLFPQGLRTHIHCSHGYAEYGRKLNTILRKLVQERRRQLLSGSSSNYFRSMRTATAASTAAVIAGSQFDWETSQEQVQQQAATDAASASGASSSSGSSSSSSSSCSAGASATTPHHGRDRTAATASATTANRTNEASAPPPLLLLKELVCSECPLTFPTKQAFIKHTNEAHLWTRVYAWRHLSRRYGDLKWKCHMCNRRQLLPAELKSHLLDSHCVSDSLADLAIKIELELEARHKKLVGGGGGGEGQQIVVIEPPLFRSLPEPRNMPSVFAVQALASINGIPMMPALPYCFPAGAGAAGGGVAGGLSYFLPPRSSLPMIAATPFTPASSFASSSSSSFLPPPPANRPPPPFSEPPRPATPNYTISGTVSASPSESFQFPQPCWKPPPPPLNYQQT